MIRLLYAVSDGNIGGAGKAVLSLLRHGDRSRFAPALALPHGSALEREAETLGVPIYRLRCPADRSFSLRAFFAYRSLLQREKFDIVHSHGSASAALAAACTGVGVRVATRHCVEGAGGSFGRLKRVLWHLSGCRSLYRIAVSDAVSQALRAEGVPEHLLCTIANGAERSAPVSVEAQNALRRRLAIPQAAPIVGFFGRLEAVKGADLLPVFAKQLAELVPLAQVIVCGTGSLLPRLRRSASECENLHLLGFCDPISPFLSVCEIAVSLSRSEASPLAIAEAVGMGIPVVVPELPAFRSLFSDAGCFFRCEDPFNAASKAAVLLTNRDAYACQTETIQRLRAVLPTAERMTAETEAFFLDCLRRENGASR